MYLIYRLTTRKVESFQNHDMWKKKGQRNGHLLTMKLLFFPNCTILAW